MATIYHNPACSTSRKVLAALREAGVEPKVVEYLKTPPDRKTLADLITRAGLTPRTAMRTKGALWQELGLDRPGTTDDAILDAMQAHPVLIERPIVATAKGVRLCRPPEKLAEILG
ncbi:arsenate reductase [Stella humosa]|uniref:Arsenate reductase n=1 Tax=Stella humosa TaxID=94 RepID=A0A3N1MEU3_9PROT|nr:arsenate reductase (glutaredoxin) [Stella humosa]ROQ01230.1 arsenate reductase [Stella humosa]BBK31604.1 arsenate reductase [Stella humosa]